MTVSTLQMSIAVAASALLPVVTLRKLRMSGGTSFFLSLAAANVLTHTLPWLIAPLDHYGPGYVIGIGMYFFIALAIAGLAMLVLLGLEGR